MNVSHNLHEADVIKLNSLLMVTLLGYHSITGERVNVILLMKEKVDKFKHKAIKFKGNSNLAGFNPNLYYLPF